MIRQASGPSNGANQANGRRRAGAVLPAPRRAGLEILYGILDLDRVTQARRYGAFGLNKPWSQLKDQRGTLAYPMFGGASFQPPEWS